MVHIMHRLEKFEEDKYESSHQRIDAFFTASAWQGEIKNMEPTKCPDLSWFPLHNLPKNIVPYVKSALEQISKKNIFSEYGFK